MSELYNTWAEKYRPQNLSHLLGHIKNIETIKSWMVDFKKRIPGTNNCLLLHGPPGVGKTSMANIIAVNDEPLVSLDFNHNPASSIFDLTQKKSFSKMGTFSNI